MKKNKIIAGILVCAALFAGCGGGSDTDKTSSNTAPKESVTKACSAELMGMSATIRMTAPAEDADISQIQMDIDMPAEYFGLENFDELSDDVKSMIVDELSSQLEIPASDIAAQTTTDNLKVVITLHDDNMRSILGLEDDASMVLQDMVKQLEDDEEAVCK